MVILHVGYVGKLKYSGVDAIVPLFVKHQEEYGTVGFLNLYDYTPKNLNNVFIYKKFWCINKLPRPFNAPDIVVFHQIYKFKFLFIYFEITRRNIPYVIVPHGGLAQRVMEKNSVIKFIANKLFFEKFVRNAGSIHFLSKNELNHSYLKNINYFILPYGISVADITLNKYNRNNKIIFTYIGRLDIKTKGLDLLINAIGCCKTIFEKNAILNIYGPNTGNIHSVINDMIWHNDVSNCIKVYNAVSGTKKDIILQRTNIFVLTSRNEGLPLSVMEALRYGIPCLVTEGTSFAEFVNKYQAGWGCKNDIQDIAMALKNAISDYSDGKILRRNVVNLINSEFDWDKFSRGSVLNYERVCNHV